MILKQGRTKAVELNDEVFKKLISFYPEEINQMEKEIEELEGSTEKFVRPLIEEAKDEGCLLG
ncbi:hypothetical protein KC866_03015 [Patescibacteria group bacterium]|nr:hypothetical protein [Patescibacteria group bacterium]